ncbi:MAG: alpha-D-ribose 1-methylphosphonate 5-triphosphate diphosphatase [Pseudomonadota bacterium]
MNSMTSSSTAASSDASDICLANARLVLSDRVLTGSVTIEKGLIANIDEGDRVADGALDCGGDFVMPGLVELHTDNLERHMEPRPGVDWPHLPALIAHDAELAGAGITTVFDALRAGSIHGGKARFFDYARAIANELLGARAAGMFKISHFLHIRAEICSETLLEELARFGADDRVGIVSLMDHTPGQRQFADLSVHRKYVTKKRGMSDDEFAEHAANLMRIRAEFGTKHEIGAVAEARRLGAVLASHDDTTVAHVQTSAQNGVGLAEFPTTLAAAAACKERGIAIVMGAPNLIRGSSHSGNVAAEELARADLLDIVSSDYAPAGLLLSAFKLAEIWNDIPRAIACVTQNPARAASLSDRGAISLGARGDVLRVGHMMNTPYLRGVWSNGARVA